MHHEEQPREDSEGKEIGNIATRRYASTIKKNVEPRCRVYKIFVAILST